MKKCLIYLTLVMLALTACVKETIELNNISKDIEKEFYLTMPLLNASLIFEEVSDRQADSATTTSQGDSILLFFPLEVTREKDTIERGERGENMNFEYFRLYHTVNNMFPIGLDLKLLLYNDTLDQNIDTLYFSETPGTLFLQPASVGADSLVIEDDVVTYSGILNLTGEKIENYYKATDIILSFSIPSAGRIVRILDHYRLDLRFGIEAKGIYTNESDDN